MHTFLLGAPARSDINPSHVRKINLLPAERRVELCISTTVFKYWKRIVPSYLNDMFMASLNNYNTRSQMALDVPLCRTIKGKKGMPFLGPKTWNKVKLKHKNSCKYSFFHAPFEKKILSKLQE